jgi:uncharacterized protein YqeY
MMNIFTPSPLSIRDRMKADLKDAFKARQTHIVTTLRSTLAEIDNAEAIALDETMVAVVGQLNERPRKTLTEAEMQAIVQKEADALRISLAEYRRLGRDEESAQLQAEWEVLTKYL